MLEHGSRIKFNAANRATLRAWLDAQDAAEQTNKTALTVVSVPSGCVERPGKRGTGDGTMSYAYLTHAAEIDGGGDIVAVLCKGIKVESLLHDSSQYNVHAVDCVRCVAVLKRRGITIEAKRD